MVCKCLHFPASAYSCCDILRCGNTHTHTTHTHTYAIEKACHNEHHTLSMLYTLCQTHNTHTNTHKYTPTYIYSLRYLNQVNRWVGLVKAHSLPCTGAYHGYNSTCAYMQAHVRVRQPPFFSFLSPHHPMTKVMRSRPGFWHGSKGRCLHTTPPNAGPHWGPHPGYIQNLEG